MKHAITSILILFFFLQPPLFAQTNNLVFTRYHDYFGRVYSDDPDGGDATILLNNIDRPKAIAVDASVTPAQIYVAMTGDSKITRYDIDGTNPVDIVTGQSGINDIELDLAERKIYWLKNSYSDDHRIVTANGSYFVSPLWYFRAILKISQNTKIIKNVFYRA